MNLGEDTPIVVPGRTVVVGRLKFSVLKRWFAWAGEQMGDPFAGLEGLVDKLPPDAAARLIDRATEERDALRSLDLTSDFVKGLMGKPLMAAQLFIFLVQSKQPEMSEDEIFEVAMQAGGDVMNKAIGRAMGDGRPNAEAPAS